MSKKCVAFSKSKLGLEKPDNKKAFYAGWDAALREALEQPVSQEPVEQINYEEWEFNPMTGESLWGKQPVSRAELKDAFQEGFNRAADLYAPQPVKEVELTDYDLNNAKRCLPLYLSEISEEDLDEFARAVIAKYKEKNK